MQSIDMSHGEARAAPAARPLIDTDGLVTRLQAMLQAGRLSAARPLLLALRRLEEDTPRLAALEAELLLAEGRPGDALALVDTALAGAPAHAVLFKRRAAARLALGDIIGAAEDAAQAVILDPRDPRAKKMLGVLLASLGRSADAITCLQEAVADDPTDPAQYGALAMAQERASRLDLAAETLALGIAACPRDGGLREAAIMLDLRERDFSGAAGLAMQARRDGCIGATGFVLLGHALAALGRHEESGDAYREALKFAPDDAQIRRLATQAGPVGDRMSAARVRSQYDVYAPRFDTHLISLGYRVPGLMRDALITLLPTLPPGAPVLDLGCGTGLLAVALADLAGPMTGVDISPVMLERAAARGLYAELAESDILDWLAGDERDWPLILAADVLIYFGDLTVLLASVARRLTPGGVFLCSVEGRPDQAADDHGWSLGIGRFAHDPDYLRAALGQAGLTLESVRPQALRTEAGAPVPGWLVTARRLA